MIMKDRFNIFTRSVDINCPVDKLFNFHLDTNNVIKISPPFLKVRVRHISDLPLKEKSQITIEIGRFGMYIPWKVEIEKISFPTQIVDLQISGPFNYWKHEHNFLLKGELITMTDKIVFILPFGIIGKIFLPFILLNLIFMFRYRHKKTKQLMENDGS